jgi:hypothetical protein
MLGVDLELQRDVVLVLGPLLGVEIDLHLDLRLALGPGPFCAAMFSKDMSRMNCDRICSRGWAAGCGFGWEAGWAAGWAAPLS